MNASILAQELEPLQEQIRVVEDRLAGLEEDLRLAEAELEIHSDEKNRFDALQEVCSAFDRLAELDASELFWGDVESESRTDFVESARHRVTQFEDGIEDILSKRTALQDRIDQAQEELGLLHFEVEEAYAREERRRDEFVIEREVSAIPFRRMLMPWATDSESESVFRRAVLFALLFCLIFGGLIPVINIPLPDRNDQVVEIPERLAMLVRKEPPRPEPVEVAKQVPKETEKKPEPEKKKAAEKKKTRVAADDAGRKAARNRAENSGMLAFKDTFKDLIKEVPAAKLGTEARIRKKSAPARGQASPQRSLVAVQAEGASGGIGSAAVSRNIGYGGGGNGDKIGEVGFSRVESSVAGLTAEAGRPVSDGPGPARTDEEIQIVFDRYKATLYRIYNKQLRKDPTLQGNMLIRLTIEPDGSVSLCKIESTDLDSRVLVTRIVDRIRRFNFGPKDNVPKTTILYPIDFLPAG